MREYTFTVNGGDPVAQHTVDIEPAATYFRLLSASAPQQAGWPAGQVSIDGARLQGVSVNDGQSQIPPFTRLGFTSGSTGTYVFVVGIGEEIRTENVVIEQTARPPPPVEYVAQEITVSAGATASISPRVPAAGLMQVRIDICTLSPGLLLVQDGLAGSFGMPIPDNAIYSIPFSNANQAPLWFHNPTAAAIVLGWTRLYATA